MSKNIDVLGFELEHALEKIRQQNLKASIIETRGNGDSNGLKRVIGQRQITSDMYEIIISYF